MRLSQDDIVPEYTLAVPPVRRNAAFAGIAAVLLFGMFSVASAANRSRSGATDAVSTDAVLAAQASAADVLMEDGREADTLDALEQLQQADPSNAVYSYLIAAHHARAGEWNPVIAALQSGNDSPNFSLANTAVGKGGYPSLPVLRQLVTNVCAEAVRNNDQETADALLLACGTMVSRLAREAQPCDISVLQNAGSMFQSVEKARTVLWEREGRFADADGARARMAQKTEWWRLVSARAARVDGNDPAVREAVAKQLRGLLPR